MATGPGQQRRRPTIVVGAPAGPPSLLIVVPLQGRVRAVLDSISYEDEEALAADLEGRWLIDEVAEALRRLADVLDGKAA